MYKVILAFRYLFGKRISYLAFLSVALCVFIVVVVMTVMRGLVTDFRQKNHSFCGDCVVGTESLVGFAYYEDFIELLEGEDIVEGVSPVIKSYALAGQLNSERNVGVEIMGIEPGRHSSVTGFGESLHYHREGASRVFEPGDGSTLRGCVLGISLALEPDARGEYHYEDGPWGTELVVTCFPLTASGVLAKAETGVVNTKTFRYRDTSHTGLARVDSSFVYLPFGQAQLLCGMAGAEKRVSRLHIKFKGGVRLEDGCARVGSLWESFAEARSGRRLSNLLETVSVQSWKGFRRPFIAAMEKEQTMMTVMFGLVGITTVFIVFVVFYMIISHKSKDIGILKSIGVSQANLISLYLGFALLVGILGSVVGVLTGWLFLVRINRIEAWLFEHFEFQLWDRTIYAIGDIPNKIDVGVLAVIVISAIAACLVGAAVPSRQAARLKPVESLQVAQL